jgi:hypothetical protein
MVMKMGIEMSHRHEPSPWVISVGMGRILRSPISWLTPRATSDPGRRCAVTRLLKLLPVWSVAGTLA